MAFPSNGRSGDVDRVGSGYLWRRITPAQADAIVRARAAGVPATTLAKEYGVSVRSIYRAIADLANQQPITVTVASWRAQFVIRPEGPVRVTAWHANAEARS